MMKIKDKRIFMIEFVAVSGTYDIVVRKYDGEAIGRVDLTDIDAKKYFFPEGVYFTSTIESLQDNTIKVYVNGELKADAFKRADGVGEYTLAGFHAGDYIVVVK